MNGEVIFWLVLLLAVGFCDYFAVFFHQKKKFPIWVSAIGMALLIPVFVGGFVYLGLNFIAFDPDDTREGVAFAGGFMAIILVFNAIIMFMIGVILNIYMFFKNRRNHV